MDAYGDFDSSSNSWRSVTKQKEASSKSRSKRSTPKCIDEEADESDEDNVETYFLKSKHCEAMAKFIRRYISVFVCIYIHILFR